MLFTPDSIKVQEIVESISALKEIKNVHHVHIWQLDEHQNALEAHVVLSDYSNMDEVKANLKNSLANEFLISHSTLEFETKQCEQGQCRLS